MAGDQASFLDDASWGTQAATVQCLWRYYDFFSCSTIMNIHDQRAGLQVSVGRDWFLCQVKAKHGGHKYASSG